MPEGVFPTPLEVSDPERFCMKETAHSSLVSPRAHQRAQREEDTPIPAEKHEKRPPKKVRKVEEEALVHDSPRIQGDDSEAAEVDEKPFAITSEILSNFSPNTARSYRIGHSSTTNIAIRNMLRIQNQTRGASRRTVPRKVPETPRKKNSIVVERESEQISQNAGYSEENVMNTKILESPKRKREQVSQLNERPYSEENVINVKITVTPKRKSEIAQNTHKTPDAKKVSNTPVKSKEQRKPSKKAEYEFPPAEEDGLDDFVTFSGRDYKNFFDFDEMLSGTKTTAAAPFVVPPPPTRASFFKEDEQKPLPQKQPSQTHSQHKEVAEAQDDREPVPDHEVITLESSPSQKNGYEDDTINLDGLDVNGIFSADSQEEAIEDNSVLFGDYDGEEEEEEKPTRLRRLKKCGSGAKSGSGKKGMAMFLDSEAEESDCDDDEDDEEEGRGKRRTNQPFRSGEEDDDDFEDDAMDGEDDDDVENSLDSFICDEIEYMSSSESQALDPDEPSEPSNRNSKTENSIYQ